MPCGEVTNIGIKGRKQCREIAICFRGLSRQTSGIFGLEMNQHTAICSLLQFIYGTHLLVVCLNLIVVLVAQPEEEITGSEIRIVSGTQPSCKDSVYQAINKSTCLLTISYLNITQVPQVVKIGKGYHSDDLVPVDIPDIYAICIIN